MTSKLSIFREGCLHTAFEKKHTCGSATETDTRLDICPSKDIQESHKNHHTISSPNNALNCSKQRTGYQ